MALTFLTLLLLSQFKASSYWQQAGQGLEHKPDGDQTNSALALSGILSGATNIVKGMLPKQKRRCVHVAFVGDKSESMDSMGRAPCDGARQLIDKMRQQVGPNTDIHLQFICFNTYANKVYDGDFSQITDEQVERCVRSMRPDGRTRLYDTAVEALQEQQAAIARSQAEDPAAAVQAVFALITDGIDNESTRHSAQEMRSLVEAHRQSGATLMFFVAANQNAKETGANLGFEPERTLQLGADEAHALGGFTALADTVSKAATQDIRQVAKQCVFTEEQRGFSVSEEERLQYDPEAAKQAAITNAQLAVDEQLSSIEAKTHHIDMLRVLIAQNEAPTNILARVAHPIGDFVGCASGLMRCQRRAVTGKQKREAVTDATGRGLKHFEEQAQQSIEEARNDLTDRYVTLRLAQIAVEAPDHVVGDVVYPSYSKKHN